MINDISQKLQVPQPGRPSAQPAQSLTEAGNVSVNAHSGTENPAEKLVESEQASVKELEETVNQLNEIVQTIERDLKFSVDETSGDTVITVLDTNSQEVIRQIPAEHVLTVRENLESLKGVLFSAEI